MELTLLILPSVRVLFYHVLLRSHVADILNVTLATLEHRGGKFAQVGGRAAVAKTVLLGATRQSHLCVVHW